MKRIRVYIVIALALLLCGCNNVSDYIVNDKNIALLESDELFAYMWIDNNIVHVNETLQDYINLDEWNNVNRISANEVAFIGLKDDGSVVIQDVISNIEENTNFESAGVSEWDNVIDIEIFNYLVIVVTRDGEVLYHNTSQEYDFINTDALCKWNDIVMIDTTGLIIGAITSKGNVLIEGYELSGFADIDDLKRETKKLKNIVDISVGDNAILTLDNKGKVTLINYYFTTKGTESDVSTLLDGATDIQLGKFYVAGIMPDGVLKVIPLVEDHIFLSNVSELELDGTEDVVAIGGNKSSLIVLTEDGTVLTSVSD